MYSGGNGPRFGKGGPSAAAVLAVSMVRSRAKRRWIIASSLRIVPVHPMRVFSLFAASLRSHGYCPQALLVSIQAPCALRLTRVIPLAPLQTPPVRNCSRDALRRCFRVMFCRCHLLALSCSALEITPVFCSGMSTCDWPAILPIAAGRAWHFVPGSVVATESADHARFQSAHHSQPSSRSSLRSSSSFDQPWNPESVTKPRRDSRAVMR